MADSAVHGNVAGGATHSNCSIGGGVRGGGLFAAGGEIVVERTTFSGNNIEEQTAEEASYYTIDDPVAAENSGGGIFNFGADLTVLDSTIYNNQTGQVDVQQQPVDELTAVVVRHSVGRCNGR